MSIISQEFFSLLVHAVNHCADSGNRGPCQRHQSSPCLMPSSLSFSPPEHNASSKSPIGRWKSYCLAVSSCAHVRAVLRDSEDDLLFAEMGHAAAAATRATAMSSEVCTIRHEKSVSREGNCAPSHPAPPYPLILIASILAE